MIRRTYAWLIRLHPIHFRDQFENEMLATFDDASRDRNSIALLFDALISLLRQWAVRPRNWRAPNLVTFGDLRRQSDTMHQRAWRLNLVFTLGCLFVVFVAPSTSSRSNAILNAVVLMMMVTIGFQSHKNGLATGMQRHMALSITADARRSDLVRKRDSLRLWSSGGSLSWPWEGTIALLFFVLLVSRFGELVGFNGLLQGNPVRFWLNVAATILLMVAWHFVRRQNLRASESLQLEIDAIDHDQIL